MSDDENIHAKSIKKPEIERNQYQLEHDMYYY